MQKSVIKLKKDEYERVSKCINYFLIINKILKVKGRPSLPKVICKYIIKDIIVDMNNDLKSDYDNRFRLIMNKRLQISRKKRKIKSLKDYENYKKSRMERKLNTFMDEFKELKEIQKKTKVILNIKRKYTKKNK